MGQRRLLEILWRVTGAADQPMILPRRLGREQASTVLGA